MATDTGGTEVYVPCKKVKVVLGAHGFLKLQHGANIMAPSRKDTDNGKGRCLDLDGPRNAQAATAYSLLLRLTPSVHQATVTDDKAKCWFYRSPKGTREGPFAAGALRSWLSKGQLEPSFPVEHGPSHVWMPLWLLARHLELLPGEQEGKYSPMPWPFQVVPDQDVVMTDAEVEAEIAQLRQQQDFLQAIAEVACMDIDPADIDPHGALTHGSPVGPVAAALLSATEALLQLPTPMDLDEDEWLPLQGEWLHPLPTDQPAARPPPQQQLGQEEQREQEAQRPSALPPLPAWSPGAAAVLPGRARLYFVIDTNVLLRPDGVALLQALRRFFAPRRRPTGDGAGAAAGSADGGDGAALSCVAVIPWAVVLELDGLKEAGQNRAGRRQALHSGHGGGEDDDDGRPVAKMARSAVDMLSTAVNSGDSFFRCQTVPQFRAAACHPAASIPIGAASINNDDRIMQCCLHLQDELKPQSAATGLERRVVLLSNDKALCLKVKVHGVPTTTTYQLLEDAGVAASAGASSGAPQPPQLEAALVRLLQQAPVSATVSPALIRTQRGSGSGGGSGGGAVGPTSASSSPPQGAPAASPGSQEPPSAPGSGESSGPFMTRTCEYGSTTHWPEAGGGGAGTSGAAAGGAGAPPPPPTANAAAAAAAADELVGEFDLDEYTDPMVSALHAECRRLTVALAPLVRDILVSYYDEQTWTGVLTRPPPWGGSAMLEVLQRQLDKSIADRIGRSSVRQLGPMVTAMLVDVNFFERGRGRPRREPHLLQKLEDFSRAVSDILQTFGVRPPPAPPLPAALLALRGGGGGGGRGSGSGHDNGGSGGGGRAPPVRDANGSFERRSAAAAAAPSAATMPTNFWSEGHDATAYGRGGATAAAATAGPLAAAPRGSAGGQLHPAAVRAAAVAQSIGLTVNLGGRGGPGVASPTGPAPAVAGSGVTAGGRAGSSARAPGGAMQAEVPSAAAAAAAAADIQAQLLALAGPAAATDPQMAQLLQQLVLLQQAQSATPHQQQQQQLAAARGGVAPGHVMRAVSDNGHPGSAAQLQQQALLQQHLQQQQQMQQQQQIRLRQEQQQHHLQQQQPRHALQRFHSDPPPAAEAAAPGDVPAMIPSMASAAAASGGSGALTQAETVALQLKLMQLQKQHQTQQQQHQAQQPHHHQQQQQQQQRQQAAALQMLAAQRAAAEAEARQAQAHAQAQAQHLARASSGGSSILSPTGSVAGTNAASTPSASWQSLLTETHQRQQKAHQQAQQQQLQMLLLQWQAAAAAAAAAGGGGAAHDVAAAMAAQQGGGAASSPEVLALLQHAMLADQQQQPQQHQQQQQQQLLHMQALQQQQHQQLLLQQMAAAVAAAAGQPEHARPGRDGPGTASGGVDASAAALQAAMAAAAAAAGGGSGVVPPGSGLVAVDLGSVQRRLSELSAGSSMAAD